jgi:EmrB/QacA subfamily drug resistance transporter
LHVQGERNEAQGSWVLVLCCLAQFMVILDVSIVNVALPSIRDDLGFSAVDLQWVVNAYTLTFAGFLLLGGRAADLLGPRRVFVAGLLLFAFASLAGGLSQSQGMLVIARGVQGLGGAIVAPVTLSILTTTFTEGAERNRALAAWGAMGAAGGATGNLLGGVLTDVLGWQWILIINLPIGVAAALAAVRFIPDLRPAPSGRRQFDLAGATSITAGLIVLTYAIVRTDVNGWGSAATLGLAAVGLLLIGLFVLIERRAERPLVPLGIFASRTLSAANFVVLLMGASAFAMWYFLSLYLQQVLGYSPIEAGLAFLPMPLTIVVASMQAARLVGRYGPGRVLAGGMALIAVGMALLARVPADGTYLENVLVPSIVTAAGIGFSFVPMTIAATNGVRPEEAGLASGLVNTSRQVGGSLGLAILATLATQRTAALAGAGAPGAAALTAGFHRAFLVGAGFALAGAIAAGLLLASTRARTPAPVHAGADA